MDEKKFLANFAKILGAESTFEELEQKRLKEERMLASLSKSLGAEGILEDIKKKEDQLIENMSVTLSKYQVAEQQAIIEQVSKELEEAKEQLVEDAKQEEPEIPASVFDTPAVEKIAKEKPKKEDIVPPSLRKELDYIKKSITDFHRFAQRHSQMSGGGAAWLWDLNDVSNSIRDALDGQVLTFNVATNKWVAATPTSGGASGNTTNLFAYVTNDEDVTIHKGDPVYLHRATGNRPSVKLGFNTGDATSAKTMGLAAEDITAHNPGWVMVRGVLTGVNTGAYNEGDTLYLGSTAGTLTSSKPYAPNHLVYIGVVVRANQGQGQIYIQPQNGYELDEIHDVNINHNVALANGHTLLWNSSNSLWENRSLSGLVATFAANSAAYLDGVAANGYQTVAGLSANVAVLTSNNALYLGGVAANQYAYGNSSVTINGTNVALSGSANISSLVNGSDSLSLDGASKINLPGGTSYIFSATNNITLAPDNTGSNFFEIINNVGATLSTDGNFEVRTNVDGTDRVWSFTPGGSLFFPDSTYQTTAWTGSVATLTSNNSVYLGGIAANQYAYANQITTYTLPTANTTVLGGVKIDGTTITISDGVISSPNQDLSGYQTTAGLSANVTTLTSNNSLYLGAKAANQYAYANGSNFSLNNPITITYAGATPTGYALTIAAANTQGGAGYADFLKITNTTTGATANNKSFRLTSGGGIEIVNSGYTATILGLSDTGDFSVAGKIQINGKTAVNGPAFSAYAAAILQTIPSDAQTKVLFQTEEFDTAGCYASSRFTPNVEGYYQLNAEVRIDGTSGTGEMMIILYKNGSEYKRGTNQSGTQIAANFWAMQVSSVVYANGSTDYFEIYVQQGSGASRTVTAVNNPAITWFNGCMLRGV